MACPAFKGFLAHTHEGNDVPTSDADDRRRHALHLHTRAFAWACQKLMTARAVVAHTFNPSTCEAEAG